MHPIVCIEWTPGPMSPYWYMHWSSLGRRSMLTEPVNMDAFLATWLRKPFFGRLRPVLSSLFQCIEER